MKLSKAYVLGFQDGLSEKEANIRFDSETAAKDYRDGYREGKKEAGRR